MNVSKKDAIIDIIISIVLAIIGIVLMAKPENTLNTIAIILGSAVIIYGIYVIVRYCVTKEKWGESVYTNNLIIGVMLIILGLILFIYVSIIESLIRIVIGIWMIYNALIKLGQALIFKDINKKTWIMLSIISILTVLLGLYITFYAGALIKILGIIILIYAIIDIVQTIIYMVKE